MRNAAAAFDDDHALDEPVRRPKTGRKARGAGAKKPPPRGRKNRRAILRYAAVGLSASLAIGIVVNALTLQHSRHPAPLFGTAIALGDTPAPAAVALPPVVALAPPLAAVPAVPSPVPPHARHVSLEVPSPVRAKGDDPIAKLLKASAEKTSDKAGTPREGTKTVLATQHALLKLGFVVKPSGTFGPGTKGAIEAFERDQHLPVKGEMSRSVLKKISAESGVAID